MWPIQCGEVFPGNNCSLDVDPSILVLVSSNITNILLRVLKCLQARNLSGVSHSLLPLLLPHCAYA